MNNTASIEPTPELTIFDGTIVHPALQSASVYITDGEEFTNSAILNRSRARFYQQRRPHDFGKMICHLRADGHLAAAKPEFPIYDHLKGRARKYLVETGKTPVPTLTPIPEAIHRLIEQVSGVEIPATHYPAAIANMPPGGEVLRGWSDGTRLTSEELPSASPGDVWHGIKKARQAPGQRKSKIKLFIVEGDKDVKALLSLGYLGISVPGHHMAFLNGELHRSLKELAPCVDVYLALDKDANPATAAKVQRSEWKIAAAMQKSGAKVRHLEWSNDQGKGIGDVLTNIYLADGYDAATDWLKEATSNAPIHFRWLDWVRKQTHRQAHRFPIAPTRVTKGEYLPSYKSQPGLTIIDAPLGAGKTTVMIDEIQGALNDSETNTLWQCPNNSLGGQVANRIEEKSKIRLPHTQDYRRDSAADITALHADIANSQGLVSCGQAFIHNPAEFFTQPLKMVIDEPGEWIKALMMSNTYGSPQRQVEAVAHFAKLFKHAARSGGVTIAQKGISRHVAEAFMALCGTDSSNTRLILHEKDSVKHRVKICTSETQVRSQIFQALAAGQRIVFYCTSRMVVRCLKKEILARYPEKKVTALMAGSENVGEFIADPDLYIESNQIDALLLSPVATSGLSIDLKGYFSTVFGNCGTLVAPEHEQGLGRVRDRVDRVVYCPDRIIVKRPKGFNVKGIIEAEYNSAVKMSRWYQLPDFDMEPGVEWAELQGIVDRFVAAQENLDNAYSEMGYRGLQLLYEEAGFEVEICEDKPLEDKELKDERKATRDGIWRGDAQAEQDCSINPSIHTEAWAVKTLASSAASLDDRVRASKVLHIAQFPGLEFDADKFYRLFHLDYGKASRQIKLRAAVDNLGVMAELEGMENAEVLSQHLKFYRSLGKVFLQAFVVHCLGLLDFHDERTQYHRSHPQIQALDRMYKQDWVKDLIFEAFGWTIHHRSNPIEFLHDIFKRLGIKVQPQGRRTILDKRELFYQTVEDDVLTIDCLEAAGRRLLERLAVKKKVYKLPIFSFTDTDWSNLKVADPMPQEQGEAAVICGVSLSEGRS
jgi:Domain of unknown function (DUF3854)